MSELRISVEGEDDIVVDVDYDKDGRTADLEALDHRLKTVEQELKEGRVVMIDVPDSISEHEWETDLGKELGALFAEIDAEEEEQRSQEKFLSDINKRENMCGTKTPASGLAARIVAMILERDAKEVAAGGTIER